VSGAFECPHCGAEVRANAKVCRTCGSDADTGWMSSEEIDYQSLDIPDGYGPDDESTQLPSGSPRWVVVTAIVLLAAMLVVVLWLLF